MGRNAAGTNQHWSGVAGVASAVLSYGGYRDAAMICPCPKPAPTQKKPRKPLRAKKSLRDGPRTPLPKVNPRREAKRRKKQRSHYASPEYKAARAERMEVSGGQCEVRHLLDEHMRLVAALLPGEPLPFRINDPEKWFQYRCPVTTHLEFHEVHYGSEVGILRPIQGYICCESDHAYIEATRHPTRKHGR